MALSVNDMPPGAAAEGDATGAAGQHPVPRDELPESVAEPASVEAAGDIASHGAWRGCPYLIAPDGRWRSAEPDRAHRCTAVRPPGSLTTEKQRRLCLESLFTACPAYLEATRVREELRAAAGLAESGPRRPIVRTIPLVMEGPAARRWAGVRRGNLQRSSQLGLVLVIVVAAAALAFARLPGQGAGGQVIGSPSIAPSAVVATQTPSPVTSPSAPIATATPAPPPSSPPTATPAAPPTAPPASPPVVATGTYRVKKGDTLYAIAVRYHTTVKALQELNGISNASYIQVGQVLKVP